MTRDDYDGFLNTLNARKKVVSGMVAAAELEERQIEEMINEVEREDFALDEREWQARQREDLTA